MINNVVFVDFVNRKTKSGASKPLKDGLYSFTCSDCGCASFSIFIERFNGRETLQFDCDECFTAYNL